MHMADALVSPVIAGTMYACSAVVIAHSVKKVNLENNPKKIPVMGVMGAFVFAAQMINFTIPGTGSSGHICGGVLLTALLGPQAAFLSMVGVLAIQCLLFADGGLLALGCNVWNMAFYGCFFGYYLVWRPMMRHGVSRMKIIVASVIGSIIALQFGAFSVSLQTMASGITDLPFSMFLSTMQPIHIAIGLVEGLITAAILTFLYNVRPEMLQGVPEKGERNKYSLKKTVIVLGVITLLIGGGLSYAASSNPDGLEWSIEKITGSTELESSKGQIHNIAEKVQKETSVLPDYDLKSMESIYGTAFSGIVGAVVVLVVCAGTCYLFTLRKKKKTHE